MIQILPALAGIEAERLSMPEPPFFLVQMLVPHSDVELSAARAKALNAPVEPTALTNKPVAAKEFNAVNATTASDKTTAILFLGLVISVFLVAHVCAAMGHTPFQNSAVRRLPPHARIYSRSLAIRNCLVSRSPKLC